TNKEKKRNSNQSLLHPNLPSGDRFRDSVALGRSRRRRCNRDLGLLSLESTGDELFTRTASWPFARGWENVSVSESRLRVHAAALRRRPALHADDVSGHLDH